MRRTPRMIIALLTALLATACTQDPPADLPDAKTVLTAGATAMAEATTVAFTIDVSGKIDSLTLHKAQGQLTRDGSAKGSAVIEQSGLAVEMNFTIVGDSAYIKGPTGGYQKMPLAFAAAVYDPSVILDPQRGITKLLQSAKNPTTETVEDMVGTPTYKISFDPDPTVVTSVLPGAATTGQGGLTAGRSSLWLDNQTNRVVKAEIPVTENGKSATVVVTFSDYNTPVTISAP